MTPDQRVIACRARRNILVKVPVVENLSHKTLSSLLITIDDTDVIDITKRAYNMIKYYGSVNSIEINGRVYYLSKNSDKKRIIINMLIAHCNIICVKKFEKDGKTLHFQNPTAINKLTFGNSYNVVKCDQIVVYNSIKQGNNRLGGVINGKEFSIVIENNSYLTMIDNDILV